jgi:hypothetical protein
MISGRSLRWATGISFAGLFVVVGMLLSFGIFMFWINAYPEDFDPKNIDYVLWTHGLNRNMNLDDALAGMTHDVWSVRLVKGLTKEQLKNRFGEVRALKEASPYLQLCYSVDETGQLGSHPTGKDIVFLRDSAWMVILDKGKAIDLVLCKGY